MPSDEGAGAADCAGYGPIPRDPGNDCPRLELWRNRRMRTRVALAEPRRLTVVSKFRPRLTYANVMATFAVFVALGGSSYAALKIGSRQLVNNTVRSVDIRNNDTPGRGDRNNPSRGAVFLEAKPGTVRRADWAGRARSASCANTANSAS